MLTTETTNATEHTACDDDEQDDGRNDDHPHLQIEAAVTIQFAATFVIVECRARWTSERKVNLTITLWFSTTRLRGLQPWFSHETSSSTINTLVTRIKKK